MNKNYTLIYESLNGGKVFVHRTHKEEELEENTFFAKILADKGKIVHLLPYRYGQGMKNPDAVADGKIMDFKYPKTSKVLHSAIQSHIRFANLQNAEIVMIYLNNPLLTSRDIKRALIGSIRPDWNHSIQEVWLLFDDLFLLELTRMEIENKSFIAKLP